MFMEEWKLGKRKTFFQSWLHQPLIPLFPKILVCSTASPPFCPLPLGGWVIRCNGDGTQSGSGGGGVFPLVAAFSPSFPLLLWAELTCITRFFQCIIPDQYFLSHSYRLKRKNNKLHPSIGVPWCAGCVLPGMGCHGWSAALGGAMPLPLARSQCAVDHTYLVRPSSNLSSFCSDLITLPSLPHNVSF